MSSRLQLFFVATLAAWVSACGGTPGVDGGTGGGAVSTGGSAATGGGNATGGSGAIGGGNVSTGGSTATGGGTAATGGGANTGGGSVALAVGAACQSSGMCQSGFCVDSVCCEVACTGGCQACSAARTGSADGTCAPVPNGGVCRAAGGTCDVAEVCTNGVCGPDVKLDAGTVCRTSGGVCDPAETCNGNDAQCPPDALTSAGVVCHASAGLCDPAETCTGNGPDCPVDVLADAGVVCRSAAGVCDQPETCTGASSACSPDLKLSATSVCRPAAGPCDAPEMCTGSTNDCPPVDVMLPSTATVCAPYRCSGTDPACATSCGGDSSCAPTNRSICVNGFCQTARLVFVTSAQFNPDFGGTDAGDAICQLHARDAGFSGNFMAWVSTPASSPAQRFTRDGGIYIRLVDKARVATDWADLTNGLNSAISYTEKGTVPQLGYRHVFTGTTGTGNFATVSGGNVNTNCNNWTNATSAFNGMWGQCDGINISQPSWTSNGPSQCQTLVQGRLYCFEQ